VDVLALPVQKQAHKAETRIIITRVPRRIGKNDVALEISKTREARTDKQRDAKQYDL
jgi:hypothetical protein